MNQLNALEGRRPDLYHVDHVSLILYEGMLHRYEKIIDKNDSKKRQNVDEQQSEFLLC